MEFACLSVWENNKSTSATFNTMLLPGTGSKLLWVENNIRNPNGQEVVKEEEEEEEEASKKLE